MAKRFKKKETDKTEFEKEEKKVNIGKFIFGGVLTIASTALFIITKGKFGSQMKS